MYPTAHIYGNGHRSDMWPHIPTETPGAILDVGCGGGGFCRAIKERLPTTLVWGIEANLEAAVGAREHADRVVHGLFPDDLPADAPLFDVVFFNDVLEHMSDPWNALRAAPGRLADGGIVIASIPNVRNWNVVKRLVLNGDFSYQETGIMDRTHLRFFTRRTARQLFVDCGYAVDVCEPHNISTTWKARLASVPFMRASREVRAAQVVVVARPA